MSIILKLKNIIKNIKSILREDLVRGHGQQVERENETMMSQMAK